MDEGKPPFTILQLVSGARYIRTWVSKARRRMWLEGYDLDLSYITHRLVAMSFPAQNMEAIIRNPMWQVQKALDTRHGPHYKVYNLCREACYDPKKFHGRVELIPFDDNHVPALHLVKAFCESVQAWLDQDPENVAVIHCRAGKGRTGLMVCSYLVYKGTAPEEALQIYARERTYNNEGVTIASQRRYVNYWSKILTFPNGTEGGAIPEVHLPVPKARELRRIRLYDTVSIDSVHFTIFELKMVHGQLYVPAVQIASGICKTFQQELHRTASPRISLSFLPRESEERNGQERNGQQWIVQMDTEKPVIYRKPCLDYCFEKPLEVAGDIRAKFYDKSGGRLFYVCFNTFFIANSIIQLGRGDLDKVGKRAKAICGSGFCLEFLFGPSDCHIPIPISENSF